MVQLTHDSDVQYIIFIEINCFHLLEFRNFTRHCPISVEKLIFSAYDLTAGLLAVIVGLIGDRSSKPRLLFVASLFLWLGGTLYFLPHITNGLYQLGQAPEAVCTIG